ncbi:protein phosphatase 2C family [Kipferlia bialata]|uniref:Protein phosphatase 2C family n=1 Tax=Kipferlia bialata TaxID=797122 RepID=A0A9K3GJA3_9EUKA|nr:protein phosphatase 2C family [Kipferlia bialata]|eukprot:g6676.t1
MKSIKTYQPHSFVYGAASMCGRRPTMEDAHSAILNAEEAREDALQPIVEQQILTPHNPSPACSGSDSRGEMEVPTSECGAGRGSFFFGVFDGHVGDICSHYSADNLWRHVFKSDVMVKAEPTEAEVCETLVQAFIENDRQWLSLAKQQGKPDGCTACSALLHKGTLYCANAGDTRCVLCYGGRAIELSDDHKPKRESERMRIEAAGGVVHPTLVKLPSNDMPLFPFGPDRVWPGGLSVSRGFGDIGTKDRDQLDIYRVGADLVSAVPEVRYIHIGGPEVASPLEEPSMTVDADEADIAEAEAAAAREAGVEFMILACDGLWDVMTSQDAVDFVRRSLPSAITGAMRKRAGLSNPLETSHLLESVRRNVFGQTATGVVVPQSSGDLTRASAISYSGPQLTDIFADASETLSSSLVSEAYNIGSNDNITTAVVLFPSGLPSTLAEWDSLASLVNTVAYPSRSPISSMGDQAEVPMSEAERATKALREAAQVASFRVMDALLAEKPENAAQSAEAEKERDRQFVARAIALGHEQRAAVRVPPVSTYDNKEDPSAPGPLDRARAKTVSMALPGTEHMAPMRRMLSCGLSPEVIGIVALPVTAQKATGPDPDDSLDGEEDTGPMPESQAVAGGKGDMGDTRITIVEPIAQPDVRESEAVDEAPCRPTPPAPM